MHTASVGRLQNLASRVLQSIDRSIDRSVSHYKSDVYAVQGHTRSLILVPIESTYATSYLSVIVSLVLSCTVSEILQVFCAHDPTLFHPNFGGAPLGPDHSCWGQPEQKFLANQP